MSNIIENQFKYQSTYPDENKGAAVASDIGGTNTLQTEGLDLSGLTDQFKSSIQSNKSDTKSNNAANKETVNNTSNSSQEAANSSTESVQSSNEAVEAANEAEQKIDKQIEQTTEKGTIDKLKDLKNQITSILPSDVLDSLKLDSLSKGIQDSLMNGTPISSILKNGIDGYISDQISNLTADWSDTKKFLSKAGDKFKNNIKDKIIGILASKLYVPEEIFLGGLIKFKPIKSNINYKNKYIRKMCFEHDFPKVLAFINKENGFRYSVEKNDGVKEAIDAAKQGSWHVSKYIMEELNKEIKELEAVFPIPSSYNRKTSQTQYEKYTTTIKELEAAKEFATPREARLLQASIDDNITKRNKLFINTENEYKKDPSYDKIQKLINTGKKQLHSICQAIIVYSYSNLNVAELTKIIKKFDIHPSAFGTKDKEFGKAYTIKGGDINTIANIVSPKESAMKEMESIKSTELVKNNYKMKYINPRNNNCKKIYVYLQSTKIHGKNAMYNVPYKERMEYPVYDMFVEAADSALSGFFDTGLGKKYVDTIYSIESAYYDYAKSVEDYLYVPSKTLYVSYNDFTKIPELNESDYEESTSSTANSNTNNTPTGKPKVETSPAGGTAIPSKTDPNTLDKSSGKEENGIIIYKPLAVQSQGVDANGNAIYGYPTDVEIKKAIEEGRVGSRNENNPYGYPIDEKGNICPIIGYDANGNAIYGSPLFYPKTDPMSTDKNGNPVFGYQDGKPILGYDGDGNPILGEPNPKYIYYRWEGTHPDSEIDSLSENEIDVLLKYSFDYSDDEISDNSYLNKVDLLKDEYKNNNIFYGYDEKGNKVIAIDEEGNTIIGYDQYDYPIYGSYLLKPNGKDFNGRTVWGYTIDGQPVYGFYNKLGIIGYNTNGIPYTTNKSILLPIGRTKEGYPIYKYDTAARPIIGFDADRKSILSYVTYSISQINNMTETMIDMILINSYGYTSLTLAPYDIDEKMQMLISKCVEGILLIPVTNYDQFGEPIFGTPLIQEINKIETITVNRKKGKQNALDYGYSINYKSDYDLKNQKEFDELESLVYKEMNNDPTLGFILNIVFWKK